MNLGLILSKRLTALFVCLSALMLVNVHAQVVTIDGLEYHLDKEKHEATITKGNNWSGELVIPSELSYYNETFTVKNLFWAAFYDCKELTKVKIPKTVVDVNHTGFPTTRAVSPDYMNPFIGCSSLEAIEVDGDNPSMCSIDGVLFSKDRTKLYCYPGGARNAAYIVPNGVTWIGGVAFSFNGHIVSVEIPATVTKICGQAFENCICIETVNLPETLTYLTSRLFANCYSLKSIDIPTSVNYIETQVFENCLSLRKLDVPESVQTIRSFAFNGCVFESLAIRGKLEEQQVKDCVFSGLSTSTTVYTLLSQVNMIKQYFSGTVLPLDEYQPEEETAATQSVKRESENTEYYDLQGRRIGASLNDKGQMANEKLRKGVYINDGRKIVVK